MNLTAFTIFVFIVGLTLLITYWATRRNKSTKAHYVAGGEIKGWQNGIAISGDYLSAGALLGLAGAIALDGFSGFYLAVGFTVALLVLLLIVAEPLRNLGEYTVADVLASRFNATSVRSVAALNTLMISLMYLIAQLVGAGTIVQLLLGINYVVAVVIIGILMTIYVGAGGMLATTWVQIVKAVLLMGGVFALVLAVLFNFDFSPVALFNEVSTQIGDEALAPPPASGLTAALGLISLGMALTLGVGGMPHILIRFLTVPDAKAARSSVITATWIIAVFFLMTPIIGYGAALLVGRGAIAEANSAGNLAAPQLAQAVGGDLFLAFISAVAFATIVAVVAGLVMAASGAFAHDFYSNVLRRGEASEREQLRAARAAAIGISVFSIILALGASGFNIAFLITQAFAVAASANFPVIVLTIFWKKLNTVGAVTGMLVGLLSSIGLILIGPNVMTENAIFPLDSPTIVSMPLAFLACYLGTILSGGAREERRELHVPYEEIYVRSNTGIKKVM